MADNKFVCRLCGHGKYEIVRKEGPYEGPPISYYDPSFIDHFECENCSVRFSNLEKFSIVDNKAKIGLMNAFPGFSVTTGLDGERLNTDEDIKQAITDVNESTKK